MGVAVKVVVWVAVGVEVRVDVKVMVGVKVGVKVRVGVQATIVVACVFEIILYLGVVVSASALLTKVMPQLLTAPVTVTEPE